MSREFQLPDETERRAFVDRLAEFRKSLPPHQQQMLDIMALTTFAPQSTEDVHGYRWFWSGTGPVGPGWYNTGWITSWDNTPYANTAYGLNAGPDGRYLP